MRQERFDDLVACGPLIYLEVELDEAQQVVLEFLKGFCQLNCLKLVSIAHQHLEVYLWHLGGQQAALAGELLPHPALGQNVNGVDQKMVTLEEVLNLHGQISIKQTDEILEALEVNLVCTLRYLDKVLDLVVVARDLGHVSRVLLRVGDNHFETTGLVEYLRILYDLPLLGR